MSSITMSFGAPYDGNARGGIGFTRLWTNGSPTSSFASQTVTLEEAATNYDGLRIVWKYSAGTDVTEDNWDADDALAIAYIYDIRNKRDLIVTGTQKPNLGAVFYAQSYTYCRRAYISADDSIWFGSGMRGNASGTDNSLLIPLFIDGVRF